MASILKTFRLSKTTDKDIIDKIANVDDMSVYIRQLIRKDIGVKQNKDTSSEEHAEILQAIELIQKTLDRALDR